jgi:hypothetical protein
VHASITNTFQIFLSSLFKPAHHRKYMKKVHEKDLSDCPLAGQCCQLLAKDFGQIYHKIRPLAKKFGRT